MASESLSNIDTKKKAYNLIHDPTILLDLIYSKYGDIEEDFNILFINQLVYDKSSHYNIYYKEYLLENDPEEYLKRYYKIYETKTRIPKLNDYYKSYHTFFCRPNFKDLVISDLMENYGDDKAEIFYQKNFENNDDKDSEKQNSESMSSLDNITDNKIIFTKKTKKIIDKNLDPNLITLTLTNNSNMTEKNTDGLISSRSKNDSFEKIVHNLIYHKKSKKIYNKTKNRKSYQVKRTKNDNNNKKISINDVNQKNDNNNNNKVEQKENNSKKVINKNYFHNLKINSTNINNIINKNNNNINGRNIKNKNSLFSLLKSKIYINYNKTDNILLNNNENKHKKNFTIEINLTKPQNNGNKTTKNKVNYKDSNNHFISSPKVTKVQMATTYEVFHLNTKLKNTPFSHKRNKTEYFNKNQMGSLINNIQSNNNQNAKIFPNNYISKIMSKKVNSRNYQENLKKLNINYRPNTGYNNFITITTNNLANQKANNAKIKNKTFESEDMNNNIFINQIVNLKENLKIYKKYKNNHRPNNSNSNNKYINNKIFTRKNYVPGKMCSKFNLIKSPNKLDNNDPQKNNEKVNDNLFLNNKNLNFKKLNKEIILKTSSISNFKKNADKINHKKNQSNALTNFLETSAKNQIYSPVTSTKQFNSKLYDINKSENIVSKVRPKIENNKINSLNINFNNLIFNGTLSNISENLNFNNNYINNSNFNSNYEILTPTNNNKNIFNNTFSNKNNNLICSITKKNNIKLDNANINANNYINSNISNNNGTGFINEKSNYISNLKNFCNFSRNKLSHLDTNINNTEDIYSLIKNSNESTTTKLINSTYTNLSNENMGILKKKKRELIIPKQNIKKMSIKNIKKDIQIKKPKKRKESRNRQFETEFGNYGATQNVYLSKYLGFRLENLELIKNISESFKTREDNKKNFNCSNYLCSSPKNNGKIFEIKPINVNRNSKLISKKYIKAKPKTKVK